MQRRRLRWIGQTLAGAAAAAVVTFMLGQAAPPQPTANEVEPMLPKRSPGQDASPSGAALAEACYWRSMAHYRAHSERYQTEAPDTPRPEGVSEEPLRRSVLSRDREGYLRFARHYARRATELARTDEHRYAATVELARIEHDASDHRTEYRLAKRLMEWQSSDVRSGAALYRAARCNGRTMDAVRAVALFPELTGGSRER